VIYLGCYVNIALIGTRGVPAVYGGFETCVEELGRRLVDRGHDITVYCRDSYYQEKPEMYLGMKLVYLPNMKKKSLDTLSHTFLSIFHSLVQPYDVLMVFNAANSPALFLPRLLGRKIAINTDGLEWKRGKWGPVGRRYYKLAEWLSCKFADRIVTDSIGIRNYYREQYGVEGAHISYGAYIEKSRNPALLDSLGISPGEYFLQVTRFEPENNPLLTIQAFKRLNTTKKLVVVGGVPYDSPYSRAIAAEADERVILPGYVYDRDLLNELWCNCFAYVHGNEVGGTNPALLQTMASGCFTIAIDVPFSHDVLLDAGIYFEKSPEDLAARMQWALDHAEELIYFKVKAVERIRKQYSWDLVTDEYEALFRELIADRR
jgi:glycosyltransferase involved in cell wall biosynthesis